MGNRLKNLINSTGKYLTIAVGVMSVDGYIKTIKNDSLRQRYEAEITRNRQLEGKVNELLENQISQEEVKTKIVEAVARRSQSLDLAKDEAVKILEISKDLNKTDITESARKDLSTKLNEHVETLSDNISVVNKKLSELIDLVTGSSKDSNLVVIDKIQDFINLYLD
jgi:hypothetical protein